MSFILDALKKLEREKETAEPGVVMVGPVAWGGHDRGRRGRALAVGAGVLVAVVAGAYWWLGPGNGTSSAPPAAVPGEPPARGAPAPPARVPSTPAVEPVSTPPPPRSLDVPGTPAPRAAVAAVPASPQASVEARPAESETMAIEEPALVIADDPPAAAGGDALPRYRLTAISSRDGHPIALLNDRLVREGDRFDDVLVLRIGTAEVEIEVDGERQTIGF